jgi:hypothetical protein
MTAERSSGLPFAEVYPQFGYVKVRVSFVIYFFDILYFLRPNAKIKIMTAERSSGLPFLEV